MGRRGWRQERGTHAVRVSVVTDPDGRLAVLLQLEDGWIVMQPAGAREVAQALLDQAGVVEARAGRSSVT